ncbi:short chain dehydrogenase [Macrophomina phaseolina]|uniref:Short chain dehydrogenase n=1 Tax=Macrophomina phaseolina TaxID=35725 RepID=A0ABQ8FTJ9_9PEZI|nr:short chain dehydrogenase [Macrophomina phaseolina]
MVVPLSLAGKVAIVTGGTRGIGAATALELAKRGAKVAITYVSPSSAALATAFVSTVRALDNGADAIGIQADVGALDSPDKMVAACVAAFGATIDILINNAGVAGVTPIIATEPNGDGPTPVAEWDRIMNVNARGVFFLTQAVAPHLPAGGGGRIVNVGSTAARKAAAQGGVYSASKAAVEAMTRAWAAELGPRGHAVNAVTPGPTATDMLDASLELPAAQKALADVSAATAMQGRLGTSEELAHAIVALVEPLMGWVTGQTISASGGYTML